MKKRRKMIAMLLSLTVVFGLCGSEMTVQTAMAQEVQEDAGDESQKQEVQEDIGDESQKPEENPEDAADQEVMEDSGQEEDTERTSQDISETGQTETMQSTEENEPDPIEDTNQPQEQGEEEIEVQGISEQPEEITEEQEMEMLSSSGLNNPRIEKDSSMTAGQKVTWDCVWFGKYPQAEVVPSASSYTAVDKDILRDGDIIENSSLYSKLQSASGWDANNDITIDGNKYRRMKKSDATYTSSESDVYNWSDSDTYHFFKYESIKWRVLKVDGNQVFLLSDVVLDDQKYNIADEDITWETSTIRSWLNGYGNTSNKQGNDYSSKSFIATAFSGSERSAIVNTSVVNNDNIDYGTEGGDNTTDKIFLLSESETYGNSAVLNGFVSSRESYDEARRSKSSTYAKAMGTCFDDEGAYKGNCTWWLRSPGVYKNDAASVNGDGYVNNYRNGNIVDTKWRGMRAALNLNQLSNIHTYAGTVRSDGTMKEENRGSAGNSGNGENNGSNSAPNTPGTSRPSKNPQTVKKAPVKISKIKLSGISKKIAAGKKIKLTASIKPSNAANKKLTWKSSNKKIATVNSKGIVTMNKKSGGKSVTITATAKDGSKVKAAYKITSMKGVVKKVAISGKTTVKVGKTLKLKAKVTASKKANKTLKWTSSNKKYATVSSSGKVKALKAGKGKKVKITAMATDGSGKKKTVIIKIK